MVEFIETESQLTVQEKEDLRINRIPLPVFGRTDSKDQGLAGEGFRNLDLSGEIEIFATVGT